jgi:maleate isomerase
MTAASTSQFTDAPILDAAVRLAEAQLDCIAWNGTSAAWLGLETDRALCARITQATGVPATSTILAYDHILRATGVQRLGLVTPYLSEIQERIIANYATQGIEVIADARLEDRGNFSFATYGPDRISEMVRKVAVSQPDAIAILCTNFRGAPVAADLEKETGIPVLDSVAVTAAHTMRVVGLNPARVTGWGNVFADMARLPAASLQDLANTTTSIS